MTVFWSDPTAIRLTLPSSDEMEHEDYFHTPRTLRSFGGLGITGPGVAEIKAHTRHGIEDAITQLGRASVALAAPASRPAPGGWDALRRAHPTPKGGGAAPPGLSKIIITYRPHGWSRERPGMTPSPLTVDIYATKFVPGWRVRDYHIDRSKVPASAEWVVIDEQVPVRETLKVDVNNGSVLGAAAEEPVRKAFAAKLIAWSRTAPTGLRHPYNLSKLASADGPDVVWTEIAEMYAELARGTNDEFLAALANELATPG